MKRRDTTARSGFSLVEVILVASILAILARALVETSSSMGRVTSTGNVLSLLQQEGARAMESIVRDLKRSGYVVLDEDTVDEREYPYTFEGGVAEAPFDMHTHAPADQEAGPNDPDFGPIREIVLVHPADDDDDGRPDYEPASGLDWSADEISYVLVTRADGVNYLERRVNAGNARRVARDVERVVFERPVDTGYDPAVPTGSVRVRLFLRTRDSQGTLYRDQREVVVMLRNELLP